MNYCEVKKLMLTMADEGYREFTMKLLPGVTNILGVRLPELRRIAQKISKQKPLEYLATNQHQVMEETMVSGYVIGLLQTDKEQKENYVNWDVLCYWIRQFIPYIDNWSICDSFCCSLKITQLKKSEMFQLIKEYAYSDHCYELRFFIVMCLNYYLNDEYIDKVWPLLQRIKSREYYVNMALAWCYSMIYVSYPERIVTYLHKNQQAYLSQDDLFVHNKTIQKIVESNQVSAIKKEEIRKFRIVKVLQTS